MYNLHRNFNIWNKTYWKIYKSLFTIEWNYDESSNEKEMVEKKNLIGLILYIFVVRKYIRKKSDVPNCTVLNGTN